MPVTSTNLAGDAGKYISDKLIDLSELFMRFRQFANKIALPSGMAKTANFTKYNRMDVVVDKLSEGVTPTESLFNMSVQAITTDQWGIYTAMTDVAQVTTQHPVLNTALKLLADAVARMRDFQMAEVLNNGTNVQYGDGSVANRTALAAANKLDKATLTKAQVGMTDGGAPPREGSFYVILCGPHVIGDLLNATGDTSFSAMANRQDKNSLIKGDVGEWQGFRFVKTNFIPKFQRLSTAGWGIVLGAGGALAGNVFYKITRKSLSRGFEEDIALEVTQAMGANTRITFTAPATAGYVYCIYAGAATGDANLFLAKENLAPSGVYNLDALPTSGANPGATPPAAGVVHPVYIFADDCVDNVEQNELSVMGTITPPTASDSDPLIQRRKVGSKWMDKAGIRDQTRIRRIEVMSAY